MPTRRISTEGRIEIPKAFRDRLDLKAGTGVVIDMEGESLVIKRDGPGCVKTVTMYEAVTGSGEEVADKFLTSCSSISSACWSKVQGTIKPEDLPAFDAAYADYRRRLSSQIPSTMDGRNAAAECLISLADGFFLGGAIWIANKLYLEALPLVLDNPRLEAHVKRLLSYLAVEEKKLTQTSILPKVIGASHSPARSAGRALSVLASKPVALGIFLVAVISIIAVAVGPRTIEPVKQGADPIPGLVTSVDDKLQVVLPTAERANSLPIAQSSQSNELPKEEMVPYSAVDSGSSLEIRPSALANQQANGGREPVSLPNGTNIIPPQDSGGVGKLLISNHTGNDAVLKLKTSVRRTTVRLVYVRKDSDVTVSRIHPGDYIVQFATGQDWDARGRAFLKNRRFAMFDKGLSFSEETVSDGTIYSENQITLHAVPNGKMRKLSISAEEFSQDGVPGKRTK